MSRISKQTAEIVAKKQLSPKFTDIQDRMNIIKQECVEIRLAKLPTHILKSFGKEPEYFVKNTTILANTLGHRHYFASASNTRCPGDATVINDALFEQYKNLQIEEDKLVELRDTLTNTIFELRTMKKVLEHFPELTPHFPKDVPAVGQLVNFDQLREMIKIPEVS